MRTHTGKIPDHFVPRISMTEEQRRVVFMMNSLLLDYPEEGFVDKLNAVEAQLDVLPLPVAAHVVEFLDAARVAGPRAMQEAYVETFDQRRRCSLFLTYYAVGDTRQRGTAILTFRQTLQQLGFESERDELPDHLCVVLEAAALADSSLFDAATQVLSAHRDGIEVLRAALDNLDSPYRYLIMSLCQALPEIDEETANSYMELIRSGPPAEMVGIGTPLPFPTSQPDIH
ncbi:nitrate reductase molybdenum cofactor assembly chaperone [Corynebacterium glutamicum]|uniref:nitrate reductase molybdenum cofactor assembly chaperone n=1 Tax=Corynebacterium TaxID=1716 RepID=UPI00071FA40E|nr:MULTISPECIES: nitrate reductase molybdenum cofactor assembly chaperone [Corynebacterium]ALP49890.1 nitrate reductase [Corynebacterium glutamicum]ANR62249.1 nitrate reductase delta chain [[Brevibacterium] flavum ZL-1]ANR65252.1 nitrate reductase delta chain [Corynebacterium glutamicum ZL-6]ANU33404.1 nitrate reductase molybdenum cofactor assembly chaperone [Corynebacterium glutamicum]APT07153.1 nitrate reductase molybdenum cofactor assembly chaperone [Corynebacterium glutamicum]